MAHAAVQLERVGGEARRSWKSRLRRGRCRAVAVLLGAWPLLGTGSALAQTVGSSCIAAPTLPITGTRIVNVSTEAQLQNAAGNLQAGDTIVLADGVYNLTQTLYVNNRSNVSIRGTSGCDGVVLVGRGMDNPNYGSVPHGIWSNSLNTIIAHLTIRDTYDNPVIFNAGAQSPRLYSVKLLNAGSQFIKTNPADIAQGLGVIMGWWNTPGLNTPPVRPPRIMARAWAIPTA